MSPDEHRRQPDAVRPEPDPSFTAELRRQLERRAHSPAWRPGRPALLALAYVGSGAALLAVAIGLA